jgi:NDP-sugar pyrophosphorylase family protein
MGSKITMFVLAAGMGSRYGGLKQMEGFGPNGETIIDYSIYDAIKAGFDRIVFVIRPDMEESFREVFLHKYQDKVDIDYCFQTVDMLPNWYERNPDRTKPWGTTHALLAARDLLNDPFLVINGDDFYGQKAFEVAAKFLREDCNKENYAIVGYPLKNVISEIGTVKRGVCKVDKDGNLKILEETFDLERDEDGVINGITWDGKERKDIDEDSLAAMNMFCYHPNIFEEFEKEFEQFLKENEDDLEGEYIMAVGLNNMVREGKVNIRVINTPSEWFGVTNPEDAEVVRSKLKELVEKGEYPQDLWD